MPTMHLHSNNTVKMTDDTIKRLIRSASEIVRKLDAASAQVEQCQDLFSPELIELR